MSPTKLLGLMSIREAAAQGIERVRRPIWAHPMDHLKLDVLRTELSGKPYDKPVPGPWVHFFGPFNQECNGRDPVDILFTNMDYDAQVFEEYHGPLPDSDEYKAAVAVYDGCLKDRR